MLRAGLGMGPASLAGLGEAKYPSAATESGCPGHAGAVCALTLSTESTNLRR